jgi:CRP-like cAMP-binding protein
MKFREMFSNWQDVVEYPSRTVIFSERDPADAIYFIMSGEIELTLQGEPLGIEREGGIIGEMATINSATYSVSATTLTKVTMARLDRIQVSVFIDENTEFAFHMMAVMANRLRAVDEYITTQPAQPGYPVNRWIGQIDLLEILKDSKDLVEFPAEAVIFTEGVEGNCMYVVMEGEVSISLYEKVLATAYPGEIVGEMALLNSEIRSATVTAKTDCQMAIIDQSSFDYLIRHVPEFTIHVMNVLANRLQIAFEMIEH